MKKSPVLSYLVALFAIVCLTSDQASLGRGFQGGGARPSLGGGARPSLGGGAVSRPNTGGGGRPNVGSISRPNVPNRPSTNARPSVPTNRPNLGGSGPSLGGVSRPNLPSQLPNQSRPSIGQNRPIGGSGLPGTGINRPATPDVSNRPSVRPPGTLPSVTRPSISDWPSLGGNRPSLPERPTTLPGFPDRPPIGGNRPSLPERPTTLPGFPDRPSLPERPTTLPGFPDRPSIGGNRPSLPERPTTLPGFPDRPPIGGNRPSLPERPTTLPGIPDRPSIGGGNRPVLPERPTTLPELNDRPWLGGVTRPQVPDRPSIGGNRPNRPNWPTLGGSGNNIGSNNNNNISINWNNRANWGWNSGWGLHGSNRWPNHWHHHGWYHGVWSGNWVNWWYRPPMAFFVGWGLGSWSGVNYFYNPYFLASPTAPFNYSQPIVINNISNISVSTTDVQDVAGSDVIQDDDNHVAMALFNDGLAAFMDAQYPQAMSKFDRAVALLPGDAVLHELRALTYFAMGEFQQSAAVLNSLLAVTPGMDWTTMSGLYGNIDDYTKHLRALEQHVDDYPDDAAAAFVLAYHYLVTGHTEESIERLQTVVRLKPTDTTAQRMLTSLSPPAKPSVKDSATAKSEVPTDSDMPKIDLVGTWLADATGVKITLTIDEKSGFLWNAVPEDQPPVELTGNLISTGDRLILETETQGSMIGDVSPLAADKFQFQIPGGPSQDPGLTFIRQR